MWPLAQITVEPSVALSLAIALATALGAFYAVKFGGAETQRLVKALHGRFDEMERKQQELEVQHAVLAERVNSRLRTPTQRFKLPDSEEGEP